MVSDSDGITAGLAVRLVVVFVWKRSYVHIVRLFTIWQGHHSSFYCSNSVTNFLGLSLIRPRYEGRPHSKLLVGRLHAVDLQRSWCTVPCFDWTTSLRYQAMVLVSEAFPFFCFPADLRYKYRWVLKICTFRPISPLIAEAIAYELGL